MTCLQLLSPGVPGTQTSGYPKLTIPLQAGVCCTQIYTPSLYFEMLPLVTTQELSMGEALHKAALTHCWLSSRLPSPRPSLLLTVGRRQAGSPFFLQSASSLLLPISADAGSFLE